MALGAQALEDPAAGAAEVSGVPEGVLFAPLDAQRDRIARASRTDRAAIARKAVMACTSWGILSERIPVANPG